MTEDEGGETGERKQTATVVEKGQGAGTREIKNRGEGVESYALSWRPLWSCCFQFDTDDQKVLLESHAQSIYR